jgi:predicted nuclease with TOPRIM domain
MAEPAPTLIELLKTWASGALVFAGFALFKGIQWGWKEWADGKKDSAQVKKITESLKAERDLVNWNRENSEIDKAWKRIDKLNSEIEELERDRDRGWDLARAWNDLAHRERHQGNNLRMQMGMEAPVPLPELEAIEGKKSQ